MNIFCTDSIFTKKNDHHAQDFFVKLYDMLNSHVLHTVHHKNTRHGRPKSEGGWKMMIFHDFQFPNVTFLVSLWIFYCSENTINSSEFFSNTWGSRHIYWPAKTGALRSSVAHVVRKKKDQVVHKTPKKHLWEVVVCKPSCTDSKAIGPTDLASKWTRINLSCLLFSVAGGFLSGLNLERFGDGYLFDPNSWLVKISKKKHILYFM